jgi:hypothetical protein
MRTTLNLDDDVAVLLEKTRRAKGVSFKQIANKALRAGLSQLTEAVIALCLSLSPQGFTASELARSELRNHSYGHAICFPGTGAGSLNIDNYFFKLRR